MCAHYRELPGMGGAGRNSFAGNFERFQEKNLSKGCTRCSSAIHCL